MATNNVFSGSIIWTILLFVLRPLLSVISAPIRNELEKFLLGLYKRAQATPNPVDDLFVGFLLDLLEIDY